MLRTSVALLVSVGALFAAGCGSDDGSIPPRTSTPTAGQVIVGEDNSQTTDATEPRERPAYKNPKEE